MARSRQARGADKTIAIRPFARADAGPVRELFVAVNRLLAPPHLKEAFEGYISASLEAEIDRIEDYYGEKAGGFWVAVADSGIVGMFGLEPASETAMELRRMYVAPAARRCGIAQRMLRFAEDECLRRRYPVMVLSTSELQAEALALYRASGFDLVCEEVAVAGSHKALGHGIRRYHFAKQLAAVSATASASPLGAPQ